MKEKISFLIFKRLFPILVIISGIIITYFAYYPNEYFQTENIVYQSMLPILGIFIFVLGLLFYSKETSLVNIYYIFYYMFIGLSIFLGLRFLYKIPEYQSFGEGVVHYIYYAIPIAIVMLFKLAIDNKKIKRKST